jgi:transposase-like protein
MGESIKCPAGHVKTWRKGFVPTRKGKKIRYLCSECGRSFYKTEKAAPAKKKKK